MRYWTAALGAAVSGRRRVRMRRLDVLQVDRDEDRRLPTLAEEALESAAAERCS